MFLYGKRPKLNEDNIEHMLHLAEFLLLPNLKSACISWLKTVNITEENCMNLLQLSSIFDFEIPKCTEYIEGHMSEMLQQSQMLNLTKDSVELLFSDKRLSYVSMDEKLTFLLRWRDTRPDQRSAYLTELLTTIDFYEVSKTMLQELKEDSGLRENINFEQVLDGLDDELSTHRIFIMKGESGEGSFWCLDLDRNKWFRIDSRAFEEERSYRYKDISGKGIGDFEIYFISKTYQQIEILTLDLQSDTCKTFKIVEEESGEEFKRVADLQISHNICIVNVNERVKTRKQRSVNPFSADMRRLHLMSLMGLATFEQLLALEMMRENETISTVNTETSTLYIGHMSDENIQMSPLLTFKDDEISQMCIGTNLTVAILFKSHKSLSLYDLVGHSLETIEVCTDYNDKLAQSEDGFIIYNQKRCICLDRLIGPSLSEKYRVKEISFGGNSFSHNRFFFCGKTWYHFYRKSYKDSAIFESLPHDCVTSVNSTENLSWDPLPLPKDDSRCYIESIKERCFEICLPKSKLRCNIDRNIGCPHCKVDASTTARSIIYSHDFDDDSSYDDSTDDDYYGHISYGFYSDDSDKRLKTKCFHVVMIHHKLVCTYI